MNKTATIIGIVVGVLTLLGLMFTALFFVIRAETAAQVSSQLEKHGIVAPAKIEAMEADIEDNAEDIDEFRGRWNALVDAVAAQRLEE